MLKPNLTPAEWNELGKRAGEVARKQAHDNGVPYSYMIGDKVIWEYPDGHKTEVHFNTDGSYTETPYSGE